MTNNVELITKNLAIANRSCSASYYSSSSWIRQ